MKMKCRDPILCYDDGTKKSFRHFSLSSPIHKSMANRVFNCGKCIFCRKKKATELAIRCCLHASLYQSNCFLTLTYDEKQESYHNNFNYKDIQDFKKKLRRYCDYHYNKKIQIFNVHEYGKNGKKHWHLVVFNHDFSDKTLFTVKNGNNLYTSQTLLSLWPHGFNTIADVNEATAMYQAQYTQKDFKYGHVLTKKQSHSKHSGIGKEYFLIHYKQILSLGFIPVGGRKVPIPRYFLKLAHKHFSHFYAPENFHDTLNRKALYRPFVKDEPKKEIADLFEKYSKERQKQIDLLTDEWDAWINENIYSKQKPDFVKSAENYIHDLNNKIINKNNL